MKAVGILALYLGYWVSYYGLTQVMGGNWGFLDLGVPGHGQGDWLATPTDSGGKGSTSAPSPGSLWSSVKAATTGTAGLGGVLP